LRRFAGRPDRDDSGNSGGDLRFDQVRKSGTIDRSVAKRSDKRRERAAKHEVRYKVKKGYNVNRLDVDGAFENEIGWTGQGHVLELPSHFLKPHLKFTSAADENSDRTISVLDGGEDERARDYAGAAREGFIFHAALISADRNLIRCPFLNKIYVRALL